MNINADNFKIHSSRVIESHVRKILRYTIDCYQLILKDGKKYDYKEAGKIKPEDFLRNGLVDDYMRKNIKLLNCNPIDQYTIINKEATESYYSTDDKLFHDDKIDIKIDYPALKRDSENDSVYYAIECKRFTKTSDASNYIGDTIKFSQRIYKEKRLPFEGQIGFIENSKISHSSIFSIINEKLKSNSDKLVTHKELAPTIIKSNFDGVYKSLHEKANESKDKFSVFHLFFDYNNIISI